MNINMEYYKIFYYVAKTKRITSAAEELALSQPAVSQAIKNLEAQIGTLLFTRTPKGVYLTHEGEVLYQHVKTGYEAIRLGERKVNQMLNLEAGELRIGASDMTLQFYLLPYLEQFHQLYPHIKVSVTNGPTPETLEALQNGRIDFGIVSTPFDSSEYLQVRVVKEIEDIFVVGTAFSHLWGSKISYEQIIKLPFICLERNTSTRKSLDNLLNEKGIVLQPEFELATSAMIVQFAVRNLGIGCVMSEFAKDYITQGLLCPLQLPDALPKRQFCIISDSHVPLSSAASKLLEMMQQSEKPNIT